MKLYHNTYHHYYHTMKFAYTVTEPFVLRGRYYMPFHPGSAPTAAPNKTADHRLLRRKRQRKGCNTSIVASSTRKRKLPAAQQLADTHITPARKIRALGSSSPGIIHASSAPQAPPTPIIEPLRKYYSHDPRDLDSSERREKLEEITRVWRLHHPDDSGEKEFKVRVDESMNRTRFFFNERQERRQAKFRRELESSLDGGYWESPRRSRREIRRPDVFVP